MRATTPTKAPKKPRLRHYANLWTLLDYPTKAREWSLERKIVAIKDAGFEGFACILNREHRRLAERYDLFAIGFVTPAKTSEIDSMVAKSADCGAIRVNVHLGRPDTPAAEALSMALRVDEACSKQKVPFDIEVHRGTSTETPEKLYALAEGFEKATGRPLQITWDFSHIGVVKHVAPPFWSALKLDPRLIREAQHFHFRPFNGHHCQIPVRDARGALTKEAKDWRPILAKTFEVWLKPPHRFQDLFACPELGPLSSGYNVTGMNDSWEDAKFLRKLIEHSWRSVTT